MGRTPGDRIAGFEPAGTGPAGTGPAGFPRSLLAGGVVDAATSLLGALLAARDVVVRITEVEAYAGADDPASHAWRGLTPRTAIMADGPGLAYVYFSYGMHWCLNVTAGPEGTPSAVLLRAGSVVSGSMIVAGRREGIAPRDWARGPARLTKALGIDGGTLGIDLCAATAPVRLVSGERPTRIAAGPRVGVSRAADVDWRFWIEGDASVSGYKRSPRAPTPDRLSDREH